ncbi:zinc finger protein 184-like [Harmonia axyridis]|uniref:zinc finger protein 184-like n=1 Tax=Harmonia axyridis TaxID=115357 RepID=UPI001E274EA3|nr:zinc finger protein 184-like [Harmonia axyridis]XP_045482472.1 zinc finger protein 184-like [Harmonia axyridis]XP_045482480.1 zinc finger protein 184-like [Harmonia axyridis]XP_045482488.1 zinc finger protein 184-like [Harmonia axyridis]XP_045482496.1 zinc finger protein 184-like [Harmonia axyridis]XP_045482505.1 zinc finger protein 184-like [Harmonia axyridis]
MGSEHYCLRWNNHQSNLLGVFSQLLRDESLVDVTLACSEGHSIRAHKVVLSACSSYFQTLFIDHPSRHPIVILKDVRFSELRTLIEFMYKGEVNVEYCQLSALLKTAESLKVKGLAEMTRDCKTENEQSEPTELVTRKPHQQLMPPVATVVRHEDDPQEQARSSPVMGLCKESPRSEKEVELNSNDNLGNESPMMCAEDDIPNDMTIHNNSAVSSSHLPPPCGRLSPQIKSESLPGTSLLPPVQQVPLSLKKEVDWGGGSEEKNTKDPPEFSRSQDQEMSIAETRFNSSPIDKPSSTQSSRSSTPFTLPFPSFTSSLLEMSLLHSGLLNEELYRCSSCMAAFPSVWLLEQHNALQHIGSLSSFDKPFICEQCGQSYRYRSAYVKHREQNHRARLPADKLFSCDVCGMQFRYLKSFKKHRLNHALEKLHGKTGDSSKVSVKSEMNEEQTNDTKCDNSSEVSSSNEVISSQDMVVVKTEVEEERDERDNNSTNEGQISDAEVEKTDSEQDNTVDSIGPLTPSSTMYNVDLMKNDQDSPIMNFLRGDNAARQRERKFACPFCGKCVRSKENLKLHVRKHTGERPFVCLFCGRAFGGKSDLTRHLRIHTGERPYHCDMCGKCFARADYLSKHLTTHINTPR